MFVEIEHDDGSQTAYFGVNDFDPKFDGQIRLWFHRDVSAGEKRFRDVDGKVTACVSEMGYDERGAFETIVDLAAKDEMEVIVGISDLYPWVASAARRVVQEKDTDDIELLE